MIGSATVPSAGPRFGAPPAWEAAGHRRSQGLPKRDAPPVPDRRGVFMPWQRGRLLGAVILAELAQYAAFGLLDLARLG
jgi:hypothetical protein